MLWRSVFGCLVLLLVSLAHGLPVPCNEAVPLQILRKDSAFWINGTIIEMQPANNFVPVTDATMVFNFFALQERGRSNTYINGSATPGFRCVDPTLGGNAFNPSMDPFDPGLPTVQCPGDDGGWPCGQLLFVMNSSDYFCEVQHVITSFHGAERESIFVNYTHTSYPDFWLYTGFHVVNETVVDCPVPANTQYCNVYRYGSHNRLSST